MKEIINDYIKEFPTVTYRVLCETFGVNIDKLFKILNIDNYKIRIIPGVNPKNDYYIDIYNSTGRHLIYSEHASGKWVRYEYNTNWFLKLCYNSEGFEKRWRLLKDEENDYDIIHMTDSNGFFIYTYYDNKGDFVKKWDVNDDAMVARENRIDGFAYADESDRIPSDIINVHSYTRQ